MGRRSARHGKMAAKVANDNVSVKTSAGKNQFFTESRKRAETQRILDKYGLGRH